MCIECEQTEYTLSSLNSHIHREKPLRSWSMTEESLTRVQSTAHFSEAFFSLWINNFSPACFTIASYQDKVQQPKHDGNITSRLETINNSFVCFGFHHCFRYQQYIYFFIKENSPVYQTYIYFLFT